MVLRETPITGTGPQPTELRGSQRARLWSSVLPKPKPGSKTSRVCGYSTVVQLYRVSARRENTEPGRRHRVTIDARLHGTWAPLHVHDDTAQSLSAATASDRAPGARNEAISLIMTARTNRPVARMTIWLEVSDGYRGATPQRETTGNNLSSSFVPSETIGNGRDDLARMSRISEPSSNCFTIRARLITFDSPRPTITRKRIKGSGLTIP